METEWKFIVQEYDTEYYCVICGCDIYGSRNVEKHFRGKRHDDALDRYGTNISRVGYNQYYCDVCECRISGYSNVLGHLTGQRHEDALEDSESESEISEESVQWEAMESDDFIIHYSQTFNEYRCFLCDKDLSGNSYVRRHVQDWDHRHAFTTFCGSKILCRENQFYCKLCGCYMWSWKNVHAHLYGDRHASNM